MQKQIKNSILCALAIVSIKAHAYDWPMKCDYNSTFNGEECTIFPNDGPPIQIRFSTSGFKLSEMIGLFSTAIGSEALMEGAPYSMIFTGNLYNPNIVFYKEASYVASTSELNSVYNTASDSFTDEVYFKY